MDPVPVPRDDLDLILTMARMTLAAGLAMQPITPILPDTEERCRQALVRTRFLAESD